MLASATKVIVIFLVHWKVSHIQAFTHSSTPNLLGQIRHDDNKSKPSTSSRTNVLQMMTFDACDSPDSKINLASRREAMSNFVKVLVGSSAPILASLPCQANAEGSRTIAQISGSGLVFKDILTVESFDDPKIKGVTLYISNFDRPLTERLQKDFFTEPSYASVTCVKNGKEIAIADNIDKSKNGEPVFEEKRSLLFKELRVQRIYDEEKNTVVYVSFNTRLDKNSDTNKSRFKSSICALSLD